VAAEAEFLRLIGVASKNAKIGKSFEGREGEVHPSQDRSIRKWLEPI
jgi:hypothetical protein